MGAELLRLFAGVFAVEVAGYAAMPNLLHLVVRMAPGLTKNMNLALSGQAKENLIQVRSPLLGL